MKHNSLEQPSDKVVLPTIATGGTSPVDGQGAEQELREKARVILRRLDPEKDYDDAVLDADFGDLLALIKRTGYVKLADLTREQRYAIYRDVLLKGR